MIAVYVSGHGFGHSTRMAEVLSALRRLDPHCPLAVVTSAPRALYEEAGLEPLVFRADECDVGLVQQGALVIDGGATALRWRFFTRDWERRVELEAEWLRSIGVALVIGDVPPLAFVAAARAGVPSVALANFSWDWIYRHLARHEPALQEAAEWAAAGYAEADLLFRLPYHGDMPAFRQICDVPLVARRPRVERDEARRRLDLADHAVVLLSFGGLGNAGFAARVLAPLRGWTFVTTEILAARPPNVRMVDRAGLSARGLGYIDLVAAADVVITKPGYGIVSDCIGAGTRIVYTDRGDFPEYPILVAGMEAALPCAYVSNDDLHAGRIGPALESVRGRAFPPPPDLRGAEIVAAEILARARGPRARPSRTS